MGEDWRREEVTLAYGDRRENLIGKGHTGDFIVYGWLVISFFRPWNVWNIKKNSFYSLI